MSKPICRSCGHVLAHIFADLGVSPLSNSFLAKEQLNRMEPFYPLLAHVCDHCFLVQLEQFESPKRIFEEYAYFSSYSDSWLEHARQYANQAITRFKLGPRSQVVEVASNDGYLLQYFVQAGIPVTGIEPAANVAEFAERRGVGTVVAFLGRSTALDLSAAGLRADLLVGNNVLAHVPDLNDFIAGLAILLKPDGVLTLEFPHLLQLMKEGQFDTIYHEHFSYFSLFAAREALQRHGLDVFDVEELATHGGSLRVYAAHAEHARRLATPDPDRLLEREKQEGLLEIGTYMAFGQKMQVVKRALLRFLIDAKEARKTVVGYGAPAKGNTLLNYCGIRTDLLEYTVDRSPHKQGKYLPGTRIPIFAPEKITETRPDYVLILPWNLREEIVRQMDLVRSWGGRFVVPIPALEVIK